ncbi:MAG TPA: hypothetical protein PK205_01285 [Promineifilum sp.]|nr:hypothetical protein [Promineifilum sp.]HRQ11918.1 hypothetical protein [Promineifilum sp.]
MDDHTDDRNPDPPPVGTPEELEEALKWLEDMTARQGQPADKSAAAPATPLDSPFRGLIDSEDGDLPDWLRELPVSQQLNDNEPESRLDWLARMAQQESIEELPTLEWRRLSEPAQSAILGGQTADMPTEVYPGPSRHEEPEPGSTTEESPISSLDEVSLESDDQPLVEEPLASTTVDESVEVVTEAPLAAIEPVTEEITFAEEAQPEPAPFESGADYPDETTPVSSIASVTMGLDEILRSEHPTKDIAELVSYQLGDEDEPLDDLDAAMAWIEELAASQNAPIEEMPSVADRALASKLMMEAGLTPTVSPLDELGSDSDFVDGLTPPHPFIEEEDYADTVVLIETLTADQGLTYTPPSEQAAITRTEVEADLSDPLQSAESQDIVTQVDEAIALEEVPEELSFEEAMAFLDEIAEAQPSGEGIAVEAIPTELVGVPAADPVMDEILPESVAPEHHEVAPTEIIDNVISLESEDEPEPLSAEDVPWLDTPAEAMVVVSPIDKTMGEDTKRPHVEGLNGTGHGELEMALLSLDALALPPGKTLDDVAAKLTTARMAPWRNMDSALDWLEQTLIEETPPAVEIADDLDDASLIEQMPEDPDAVLAWLEQIAAQEDAQAAEIDIIPEKTSTVIVDQVQSEPVIEELVEADLLDMPDDPDEVMAWLESLAHGGHPTPPTAERQVAADAPQPEDFVEAAAVVEAIAEEEMAAEPETARIDTHALDDQSPEEPEIEIFIDQEVVTLDTDVEDHVEGSLEEPVQSERATTEGTETVGDAVFVESPITEETVDDVPIADDIIVLDEQEIEAEAAPAGLPEQEAEAIELVDSVVVDIDDTIVATEEILVEELNELIDEESAATLEDELQLPSWLDLLRPLD